MSTWKATTLPNQWFQPSFEPSTLSVFRWPVIYIEWRNRRRWRVYWLRRLRSKRDRIEVPLQEFEKKHMATRNRPFSRSALDFVFPGCDELRKNSLYPQVVINSDLQLFWSKILRKNVFLNLEACALPINMCQQPTFPLIWKTKDRCCTQIIPLN